MIPMDIGYWPLTSYHSHDSVILANLIAMSVQLHISAHVCFYALLEHVTIVVSAPACRSHILLRNHLRF